MTPRYRPDIDGLRAVAVLSVLLFHNGVTAFSGGYVGVDIFFVISGYLITAIIVREIETGDFSIGQFYERRFRRILPALVVVIMFTFLAGTILFDATQLKALAKSVSATALFSSNILFHLQSGYFDAPSELKPLLHTWSLAVEEQFYIFFPLLLIWLAKSGSKKYTLWLIPLAIFSCIASIAGIEFSPSGTFYLLPTRAWEFLIGSILAIHTLPHIKQPLTRDILATTGLVLISFSLFAYTPNTNFPGIAAIAPTVGAALIIYAGAGGTPWVSRVLSFKPVVFIGLISYSLYLWHWPLLVYTKYYAITEPQPLTITIMVIATFVLAIISWRYVETPFRKKKILATRHHLLTVSLLTSAAIAGLGYIVVLNHGLPNRYESDPAHKIATGDPEWKHWEHCENIENRLSNNQDLCTIGRNSGTESFIFWGDSHARAMASAIDLSAKRQGVTGRIATRSACPPLLSIDRPNSTACYEFNEQVLQYIANKPTIQTVILAARWALSANGTRYKNESGPPVRLIDLQSDRDTHKTNVEILETGLRRTAEKLQSMGKTVVLVDPVPEVGFDVPSANFIAQITGRDANAIISPRLDEYLQRTKGVTNIFNSLKQDGIVKIINPSAYLCDNRRCKVVIDATPIYRDDDHLSTFGSKYIAPSFDEAFTTY